MEVLNKMGRKILMKNTTEVMRRIESITLLSRIRSQQTFREMGLYQGQLPILDYIRQNPDCNQADVAKRLHVTPATIAISTKRMEKGGLLTKRVDADNLRCKHLNITEEGRAKCEEAVRRYRENAVQLFQGFEEGELEQLENLLDRLLRNLAESMGEDPNHLDIATLAALARAGDK